MNPHSGHIVSHFHQIHASVFAHGKRDLLRISVPWFRSFFTQIIRFSGSKLCCNFMGLLTWNPAFQDLPPFITDSHMVSRKLLAPGKSFFWQHHMSRTVSHHHDLPVSVPVHSKRYIFRQRIAIARFHFMQPVFTACCQLTGYALKLLWRGKDQFFPFFKSRIVSYRFCRTFIFVQNLQDKSRLLFICFRRTGILGGRQCKLLHNHFCFFVLHSYGNCFRS